MRILVVEDERSLREALIDLLGRRGFEVEAVADGMSAVERGESSEIDLVLLDLALPRLDGVEACRRLRMARPALPILILTARGSEDDRVKGLSAGADDYLTKPFGSAELLARLRAVLRRAPAEGDLSIVAFGDLTVDFASRAVRRSGVEVKLTPKEYALLRLLVLHRGKVLTHQQLLRELWGPKAEENTHYLRVHMTHLRQKLEADPHRPRHLKTESGIGYRLVEE